MSTVSVKNLGVSYGKLSVIDDLSLEIASSEFIVLLGPSGCGKSTLLNAIAGLQDVASGSIHIDGHDMTRVEPKDRGIAMVFQSYALYPRMRVRDNLGFGLKVSGLPKAEVAARVEAVAKMLQLDELLDRRPAELSGGQRQRVAIGRAVVRDASVFLFDEPLSNLDAQLRADLRVEIKRLHQRLKATMIYVTHDQVEAMTLADRIAVMKDRVIQQLDTPDEIYNRPANTFVAKFVGSPAMNFIDAEVDTGNGAALARFDQSSVALDRVPGAKNIILGIRPEHIRIRNADSGLTALVDVVEPLGSEKLVWLKLGGRTISVRTDAATAATPGGTVSLEFPTDKIHVFARDTGKRL